MIGKRRDTSACKRRGSFIPLARDRRYTIPVACLPSVAFGDESLELRSGVCFSMIS